MIKLIAVTLGIATLATMAGYASGKVLSVPVQPVSIASMDKETFDITSTTTPADNGKEKKSELIIDVTDAVDRTFVYDGEKHSFKIPKITIAGVNTDEINKTIRTEIEKAYYEGENKEVFDSKYQYFVNNNLVSVIVSNVDLFGSEFEYLKVFNIDASTGKLITADEVVKLAGLTDGEFFGKVKDLYAKFNNLQLTLEDIGEEDKIALAENFEQISYQFVQPYIGSNGKLCFVGDVFCTGGSGVAFENFEVN